MIVLQISLFQEDTSSSKFNTHQQQQEKRKIIFRLTREAVKNKVDNKKNVVKKLTADKKFFLIDLSLLSIYLIARALFPERQLLQEVSLFREPLKN